MLQPFRTQSLSKGPLILIYSLSAIDVKDTGGTLGRSLT
jgi:hypothetical protein